MRRPPATIGPFASYCVTSCGRTCETSPSRRKVKPPTGRLCRRSWAITGSTTTGGVRRPCWRHGVPQTSIKGFWYRAAPRRRFAAGVDHQITELCVHAWDLTKAAQLSVTLDDELAEHALAWSRQMLQPQFRGQGKAFGNEVPVPADATATTASLAGSVESRVGSRHGRRAPEWSTAQT